MTQAPITQPPITQPDAPQPDSLQSGGGGKLVGGVAWGVGGAAGQALFQLLVFIVLARALSPEAFGIVAIATAIIDLLNYVGRGGVTEVLVQRRDLDQRTMNAGFFASLIAGSGLTLMLCLLAPVFGKVFQTPELPMMMVVLSPVCVLYASGAVYEGIIRHAFQFKQLALRNTTSTIVSGLIALIMALNGWGVWSLVAQRLVASAWSLAAMMLATRWWPTLAFDPRDMLTQLRQGSAIAISSVLGAGNQRIVDLVVGFFLGPVQLGYLRVAWRMLDLLVEVVVRPIGNVSLTALPRAKHAGRSVEDEYVGLLRYAAIFIVPTFLGFAIIAPDVVPLVFGAKWLMSAKLLSILCFAGLFLPLTHFKSGVLIANRAYAHVLYLNLLEFLLSLACVIVFAPFGLVSAAIGHVVRAALAIPMSFAYLHRVAGISAWRCARAGGAAAVSACCMLAATYAVRSGLPPDISPYARLAALIIAGAIAYAGAILLIDRKLLSEAARLRTRMRARA